MKDDIVKIQLEASIENIKEIEEQIEELQNKLSNIEIRLRFIENSEH